MIYYRLPRNSKTGKEFAKIETKVKAAHNKLGDLIDKIEAKEGELDGYIPVPFCYGGLVGIALEEGRTPCLKTWKENTKIDNMVMYVTNKEYKEGQDMEGEIFELDVVKYSEVNKLVGEGFTKEIFPEVNWMNEKYFGIGIQDEWEIEVHPDFEEITRTSYREQFKDEPEEVDK